MEIYVLYDDCGIIRETGYVDQTAVPDGSTMYERVQAILAKTGFSVLYLPDGPLPGTETHHVQDGKIVEGVPSVVLVEQILATREARYRAESDPLFFREQRGEVEPGTWKAKVIEIRAELPYPE